MATAAQILANQNNAQLSTGPVTPEGKARGSQNATTLGLFSASAFVRADEHEIYEQFRADWNARLVPDGPVEEALVAELIQAAWRLRRCGLLESTTPDATAAEDLDRMQASIDRARAAAQRALQRNLTELRQIQTERQLRRMVSYGKHAETKFGLASINDFEEFCDMISRRYSQEMLRHSPAAQEDAAPAKRSQTLPERQSDFAERSQSEPRSIPRSAPCPCNSGEKYKRCCGKNAPPVLSRAA